MAEIVFQDESCRIMGACFDVYKEMGSGFVEPVYQECLEIELRLREIPFRPQVQLELKYKAAGQKKSTSQTYQWSTFAFNWINCPRTV